MPTDTMDNRELLELTKKNALLQLDRMEYNDPNRGKVVNELETVSKILNADDQTEQTRLNNNARNDIDEAKLIVEQQKVENEKRRMTIDGVKIGLGVVVTLVGQHMAYHMEETKLAFKGMANWVKEFANNIYFRR